MSSFEVVRRCDCAFVLSFIRCIYSYEEMVIVRVLMVIVCWGIFGDARDTVHVLNMNAGCRCPCHG